MPRAKRQAFVWVPRDQTTKYVLKIDGTDYTTEALGSGQGMEFSKFINPDVGGFKFSLENTTAEFSDLFSGGETVQFFMDFVDGTTKVFEGTLEKVENVLTDSGYRLKCEGSHLTGELLDITVTKAYNGNTTITDILKDIIDDNLTGFTYSNVGTFSDTPTINWQDKPFWDCVTDLVDLAGADCYVDDDKDFHFFTAGSITNTDEAIVWNDTLIRLEGLGTDTIDIRNKVKVIGKDNSGISIFYTATDSTSESSFGVKEKIIRDENIKTYVEAKERGDAELALLKDTVNKGKATSWILPSLVPGEKLYIINPLQKIHDTYRAVGVTHRLPAEQTIVEIAKRRTLPSLFKDRFKKELALESIDNINKLDFSYNFGFDDTNDIDLTSSDSNIAVADSNLYITSGTDGTMVSKIRETDNDVTQVELRIIGEAFADAEYAISAQEPTSWQTISNLNTLTNLTNVGKRLKLRIKINSTSTRIDSAVVLYK